MNINFDIPWPKKGDSIHNKSEDGRIAILKALAPSFYGYAISYKNAADLTYKYRNEYTSWEVDSLVYPMFFLYRQYIELMLKEIIKTGDEMFHTRDLEKSYHHRILDLWNEAEKILQTAGAIETQSDHNVVRNIIKEFNKIDPESVSFRYPIDKNNMKTLSELNEIDLKNIYERMQGVRNYLEGCIIGLYDYKSFMEY